MVVLLVEDNSDLANALAELLRLDGHQVSVEQQASHALAALGTRAYDLVLCDLGLGGGMNGFQFAQAVRNRGGLPGTRLVAMSGHTGPEYEERALAAGFDHFLPKPVRLAGLRSVTGDPGL